MNAVLGRKRTRQAAFVLAPLTAVLLIGAGCASSPTKTETSAGAVTIHFAWPGSDGLSVKFSESGAMVASTIGGDTIKATYRVVKQSGKTVTLRITCDDDTTSHDVDVVIGGGPTPSGCRTMPAPGMPINIQLD